jgi:hypothetical protein
VRDVANLIRTLSNAPKMILFLKAKVKGNKILLAYGATNGIAERLTIEYIFFQF